MDFNLDVSEPPFEDIYKDLLLKYESTTLPDDALQTNNTITEIKELPLVNLEQLVSTSEEDREKCKREIVEAAKEWGFFQVVNHGISTNILENMIKEQVKAFKEPFDKKKKDQCLNMSLSPGAYRWGTPSPTCLEQLNWSEAFHIPFDDLFRCNNPSNVGENSENSSATLSKFAKILSELALKLAYILDESLGEEGSPTLKEIGLPNNSHLRMNRYPPCPKYYGLSGLMPHTDSDFLTILYQDQVGGLQLINDGKWIQVKPNPDALIVNIGDLFQAWSNGVYKSVEHRVKANKNVERYSVAYFLTPSSDTSIESRKTPPIYRKFTFGEYRQQTRDDASKHGSKIGLSRFLLKG